MPQPVRASRYSDRYVYDTRLGGGRYRDLETGRLVTWERVRQDLDTRIIQGAEDRMAALTQRLQQKQVSLADWQRGMAQEIKDLHGAAAIAGNGGWHNMTPADWGRLGQTVKGQRAYLQGFALDLESGKYGFPPDGRAVTRARMYGQAGRATAEEAQRRDKADAGLNEERRILGKAEHCPTCLEEAAKGWQPIGTLRRIGDSECTVNCHCHFEYRSSPPTGEIPT